MALDAFVFVYGTLKTGYHNYNVYLKPSIDLGKAAFVGTARTSTTEFVMVLKKDRFVPCLFRAPAGVEGYAVPGEVYRVDADALEALDLLEGVDERYYVREDIDVTLESGERIVAGAYLMPIRDDLLELARIDNYTDAHHDGYKSRTRTPKLKILKCIYGQAKADAVQALLDQGVAFEDAWQQVVG